MTWRPELITRESQALMAAYKKWFKELYPFQAVGLSALETESEFRMT